MSSVSILFAVLGLAPISWAGGTGVSPTDPHVRYVGRFDYSDPDGPRCAWSASTVEFTLTGTSVRAKLRESGADQFQVVIDHVPTNVLKPDKGEGLYEVATGLSKGKHLVQIVKRTEASQGTVQFLGFVLDGKLSEPPHPKHILEVIGDSISCGYGNEGKTKEEHFKPDTENAYMTYGAIAARELHADFLDIAWSGRKMWPDNTVPELYDLALPEDKSSTWNLHQQVPDVIVINLATNDFGAGLPDEKGWTEAYSAFIQRLRTRAPNARIYCAIGPMMSDGWPPDIKALSTLRRYLTKVIGLRAAVADDNIRILEFETQDEQRDGIGSDWHPTVATHTRMADALVTAVRTELKWRSE